MGGVNIPFEQGLLGHSDADCVIHALSDALLGAAGLPDIGNLFPDDEPEYKNLDSSIILEELLERFIKQAISVRMLTSQSSLKKPKLTEYIPQNENSIE